MLSTGEWLTRERAMRIATICGLVSIAILAFLLLSVNGTLDSRGRPLGTDFSQVWTAGRMVLDGHAADVWDWEKHFAVQHAVHGPGLTEVYGWHYPPPFLYACNRARDAALCRRAGDVAGDDREFPSRRWFATSRADARHGYSCSPRRYRLSAQCMATTGF